mmetsp:Transcript_12598/g.20820  ORF Transcript_12598/g.20820 Transcript_12598/m.20820 type:complete len:498 (-) Transcript_12598:134-1627(-)
MSLLNTVRKELGASTSRDLTDLVKQVTLILPQFSDDSVCEALVQCDEDVERAIELLLSRPAPPKKPTKAKKTTTQQQSSEAGPSDAGNSSSQSGSKSKEISAPPARDLTPLVEKIVEILPRCSEDAAYEALVQAGEDVEKAMGKLVNKYLPVKKPSKASADACDLEERPKTPAEKEVHKLTKKLREIGVIEERLRSGEKVDALQMPKLEKKGELLTQLHKAEADAKLEAARADAEEQKRIMQLREAALQAARDLARAEKAAMTAEAETREKAAKEAAIAAAYEEEQRQTELAAARDEAARESRTAYDYGTHQQEAPQSDQREEAGMALLSMLHGSRPDASTAAKPPRWSDEDIMNEYTTPLANAAYTKEQLDEADRIAQEIEEEGGYETRSKGKGGKSRRDDNRKGGDDNRGYGNYRNYNGYNSYNRSERRDEGGKGKSEGKNERDRKGKSKGKGKEGKDGKDGKDGRYGADNGDSPQRRPKPEPAATTMSSSRLNW